MRKVPGSGRGLAAAIVVAGMASACAPQAPTMTDRIRGSDLRLLPRESVGLAVVEMKSLRDRQAAERWLDDLMSGFGDAPSLGMIRQVVGPDVIQKVDRVALALVPRPGEATGYVVLAEGAFEESRMRDLTGGRAILTIVEVAGRPDVSLAVLPGGNPVLGPRGILERVLGTAARRGAGLDDSSLVGILRKVQPSAHIWGAIDYAPLADLARRAIQAGGGTAPLSPAGSGNLRALAFQGIIDKTIAFDLFGQADAEPGARQLADAARGLVALARLSASQQEARPWLEFLDGISIDQSGHEIQVHGTLTGAMAQALAGHLPGRQGRPGAPGAETPEPLALPLAGGDSPPAGTPPAGGSRPPG